MIRHSKCPIPSCSPPFQSDRADGAARRHCRNLARCGYHSECRRQPGHRRPRHFLLAAVRDTDGFETVRHGLARRDVRRSGPLRIRVEANETCSNATIGHVLLPAAWRTTTYSCATACSRMALPSHSRADDPEYPRQRYNCWKSDGDEIRHEKCRNVWFPEKERCSGHSFCAGSCP